MDLEENSFFFVFGAMFKCTVHHNGCCSEGACGIQSSVDSFFFFCWIAFVAAIFQPFNIAAEECGQEGIASTLRVNGFYKIGVSVPGRCPI